MSSGSSVPYWTSDSADLTQFLVCHTLPRCASQIADEMRHLESYFYDEWQRGRRMVELYELVQHAGNIVPRYGACWCYHNPRWCMLVSVIFVGTVHICELRARDLERPSSFVGYVLKSSSNACSVRDGGAGSNCLCACPGCFVLIFAQCEHSFKTDQIFIDSVGVRLFLYILV